MSRREKVVKSKAAKIATLSEVVLGIVAAIGVEGITHSRAARAAGLSRAWIYKYAGSRDELIALAADHFGMILAALDETGQTPATPGEWLDRTLAHFDALLAQSAERPALIQLYFRFRGTPSVIGRRISRIETMQDARTIATLKSLFGLTEKQARAQAEIAGDLRMGLLHAWACGELRKVASAEEVRQSFGKALAGLFAA